MKHTRILSALIAGLLATSTLVSGLTVHAAAESGTKAAAQTYVAVSQPTTHIVGDIAMIREINSKAELDAVSTASTKPATTLYTVNKDLKVLGTDGAPFATLDEVLTAHPEVEFVQIQLNYLDWEDERIQSRKCYETIVRHGKDVVVMEPVKGGKLATVPAEVATKMTALHPDWSPASWAIRFAASLSAVKVVLSGMSNQAQLDDNTGFMVAFTPLNDEEMHLLEEAADIISKQPVIDCTVCHYCEDGCPSSIPIPAYFGLYNKDQGALRSGNCADKAEYRKLAENHGLASECVECGQCESACPQHLPIMASLKKIVETYEK